MKAAKAARITRASVTRVLRRIQGIPRSSSRGGHNKKLDMPSSEALKEYLLMCHALGLGAGIDNVVTAANSILRCQRIDSTASHRWAKNWLGREGQFVKTLRSTPLSAKHRAALIREDIIAHFAEFDLCQKHWGIVDNDIYNIDETGCMIGMVNGSLVIVPTDCEVVYVDNPEN
jgi:hypothetical protein